MAESTEATVAGQSAGGAQAPAEQTAAKSPEQEKGAEIVLATAALQEEEPPVKRARPDTPPQTQKATGDAASEDFKSLNARQYLEKTVVPLLMQGLQQLVKDRPSEPCLALSEFLRENNPKK